MADDKKRYIGAGLSDEDYYTLIKMATYRGQHPTTLIEEYVNRGLTLDVEQYASETSDLSAELQVFHALQNVKSKTNVHMMLKQIASSLLEQPDEILAEELHTLCDIARVSFEAVMTEVQSASLNVRSAISFDDDSSIAHVKTFLLDIFKNEVELKANDVVEMGEAKGYSRATIREAKQDLGIMSIRRAKSWVWVLPTFLQIPASVEVSHGK